jgi:hypothetical protein
MKHRNSSLMLGMESLEGRLVPSAVMPVDATPAPAMVASADTQNSDPSLPTLVGYDSNGEAIYAVTVAPVQGKCTCRMCTGFQSAISAGQSPVDPISVSVPVASVPVATLASVVDQQATPTTNLGGVQTVITPSPSPITIQLPPANAGSVPAAQEDMAGNQRGAMDVDRDGAADQVVTIRAVEIVQQPSADLPTDSQIDDVQEDLLLATAI